MHAPHACGVRALRVGLSLFVGLALVPPDLVAQEIRYSGLLGYAQGDYIFTQRTESVSLINGLSARWARLGMSVSFPVVAQTSTAVAFIHGLPVPTGGPDNRAVGQRQPGRSVPMRPRGHGPEQQDPNVTAARQLAQEESLEVSEPGDYELAVGDPLLGLAFELFQGLGGLRSAEVEGMVKAPVADVESGVGTGEWDYGLGGSLVFGLGRALLLTDATYWTLGDMPGLELKSYFDVGAGIGHPLREGWTVLASIAAASEIIENVDPPASASVAIARRWESGGSLSGGVSVGLTESASDLSIFLGWGIDLVGSH